MVTILMMSPKMATLGLLKIKVFWNKGYGATIYVHDVTNKLLSYDSNYIVDVVAWLYHFYERSLVTLPFLWEKLL